jgi:hypothetical protein
MRAFVPPILCALVLIPALTLAGEPLSQKRYSIKHDDPSTGTHVARDRIVGSIPLDKRYSELTREQQDALKSQYEQMAENDEPPFPVDGLGPLYKGIAEVHKQFLRRGFGLGADGFLALHVQVDSQGKATSVSAYRSPDPEMTKYAATVAMLTKYKPAVCVGQPCAMIFPIRIELKSRH